MTLHYSKDRHLFQSFIIRACFGVLTLEIHYSSLNMKLLAIFQVVKLHFYKYWMAANTEARTGIDFILFFNWTSS